MFLSEILTHQSLEDQNTYTICTTDNIRDRIKKKKRKKKSANADTLCQANLKMANGNFLSLN